MSSTSFNGSIDLNQFIQTIYTNDKYLINGQTGSTSDKESVIPYFNSQLFQYFHPDITGYTLAFLVPPPFKALSNKNTTYIDNFKKLTAFAAVDYTPPQRQVETEKTESRSGGIPFVTEITPSQQCNVTFVDNKALDIFNYHSEWLNYMHELVEGIIEPPGEYLDPNSELFGSLDYAGSLFFVKYEMNMKDIKLVGKATGVYPNSLPNKEVIGDRTSNDIPKLPFTYFCGYYEETLNCHHQIWKELEDHVLTWYN